MKLYEIADNQRAYFDKLIESAGELTPELEAEGNTICSDMKQKVTDCLAYRIELEAQYEAIANEYKRLELLQYQKARELAAFEAYMLRCLGPDCKIETALGRLSFSSTYKTEVLNTEEIPEELWHYYEPKTPDPKPDLAKAIELHKQGLPTPGIKVFKNYSLRVR